MYDWLKPVPFWTEGVAEQGDELIRPVLLEFTSDAFMEDFLAESDTVNPLLTAALKHRILTPAEGAIPKLFQPAHGQYYLVCASLCCRELGFPDREVRRAEGESVFFVLRKLVTDANGTQTEYGWTIEDKVKAWKQATPKTLLDKEERLPLFSTAACCSRTYVYGYIPVASGETYKQQVTISDPKELGELDRRMIAFDEEVVGTLQVLKDTPPTKTALAEEITLFLLADLLEFLGTNLPNVAKKIRGETITLAGKELDLYNHLNGMKFKENGTTQRTAVEALKKVSDAKTQIDALSERTSLPLHFQIDAIGSIADLRTRIREALPIADTTTAQKQTAEISKNAALLGETFILRCVYERPCDAPFPPRRWISKPTLNFQMAAFFDTDAPARPIRIELPTDTSIAAMRKFKKGVGFVISNSLRNKMEMIVGKEKTFLKDNDINGEGGWSLGMLCSLSIPIITLCAFILLFILVFVLNIVFWWIPFFRICLPIPKKGK